MGKNFPAYHNVDKVSNKSQQLNIVESKYINKNTFLTIYSLTALLAFESFVVCGNVCRHFDALLLYLPSTYFESLILFLSSSSRIFLSYQSGLPLQFICFYYFKEKLLFISCYIQKHQFSSYSLLHRYKCVHLNLFFQSLLCTLMAYVQ